MQGPVGGPPERVVETYSIMDSGQLTLAANVTVPLSTETYQVFQVLVQAGNANTGTVYVGNAMVQYVELPKGTSLTLPIDGLNKVYVKGTAGDVVNWMAFR